MLPFPDLAHRRLWSAGGDEANVIDQILDYSFGYIYGMDYPGDGNQKVQYSQFPLSNFTWELYYDLQSVGVPMVMAADTWGLQGWPGVGGSYGIHLVTINGYSPNANNNLWYFDSANNSSAYGNSVR